MAGCLAARAPPRCCSVPPGRLAERGIKLVLVDADLDRPRIAKRLGVQPQAGWNETSDEDGMPLDHAVVEAVANELALSTSPRTGVADGTRPAIGRGWPHALRPSKTITKWCWSTSGLSKTFCRSAMPEPYGQWKNRRRSPRSQPAHHIVARLGQVEQELTASGVALAGMIENFVAS